MNLAFAWPLLLAAALLLLVGALVALLAQRDRADQERRRADTNAQALRVLGHEHAELRAALEAVPDGLLVLDRQGGVIGWNTEFLTLTGTPGDTALAGATLEAVLRAQAEAGEFGLVDVAQEVGRQLGALRAPGGGRLTRERPDGRFVEIAATALSTGGMVLRCQDVTARRAAQALREDALRQAEARSAAPAAFPRPMPDPAPALGPAPVPSEAPLPLRRCHVLLVEDLPVNQIVTATQLRREGHRVDVAASGAEAVRRVATAPYDLVLMDLMMPGMSGFDAARQIRRLPEPAGRVPIHALTATTDEDDRARCLAAGMQGMVSKPVPAGVLARLTQPPTATPPPPAAEHHLLDPLRLAELRRDLPAATLATLCGQCAEDMRARLGELSSAATRGDVAALEAEAHAIAGMAASYGMAEVERQMRALMALTRRGDLRAVRTAMEEAVDSVSRGTAALTAWARTA